MDNLNTVLADKQLTDLIADKPASNPYAAEPSVEQIEEAIKYLKYQQGGLESDGMNEYMGYGDGKICMKVGISKEQLETIKAGLAAKLEALTPIE